MVDSVGPVSDDAPVLPYVPPPPPKTSKAARTRERLLAVAFDLFVVHGYSAVSMRDVASAAGLTKGAVYGHFRSKGQLLVEVIRWRLASGDYSWEHRSRERLRRGGTKMLLGGGQNLGGLLAVDAAAAARHDPDVAAGLAELHAERAERIVAVIQADGMHGRRGENPDLRPTFEARERYWLGADPQAPP